ncbi:MAG TPA: hypothetical protein VL524_18765, partial [Gemmatimonadaceae bacterium]|nr:hypothetical protein [Gemmatimonadaceae bacterium]
MHPFSIALRGASMCCVAVAVHAQTQPSLPLAAQTAQAGRPVPGPVYEIPEFTRAVARGTRTRTGAPGSAYWVQHARYTIDARLDSASSRISASEQVVYLNNSPDTLRRLAIHLRQNAFAAGNPRRQSATITGGVALGRVVVNGSVVGPRSTGVAVVPITDVAKQTISVDRGYTIDGTVMWLPLATPLLPHDSARLEIAWSYVPPPSPSDGRQGREGSNLFITGYWYPQVAVYDDVHGWVADPYLLEAEFYMDPADYDVRLTVPRGWVVGATGALANPGEVLTPATRARLADARRTGAVVHVVEPENAAQSLADHGATATWHFVARDVRDFAWATSNQYVWDATRALVGGGSAGAPRDTVDIYSY